MSTGAFPQPNYPGFPPPQQRPRRAVNAGTVVGATLAVVAAAALVAGSLLPSLKIRSFTDGALDQSLTITAWGRTFDPQPTGALARYYSASHVPLYGIPLAAIAAGLLAAAGIAVARRGRAARTALLAAATAALAAAFMLAMDLESSLSYAGGDPTPGSTTDYTIGLGSWIIGGGAVLALIAALCSLGRTSRIDNDATPPQGFPAPPYPPPPRAYAPRPQYYPAAPPRTPPPGFPQQPAGPAWPREELRRAAPQDAGDDVPDDVPLHGVLDPHSVAEDGSAEATESTERPRQPPPWAPQRPQNHG